MKNNITPLQSGTPDKNPANEKKTEKKTKRLQNLSLFCWGTLLGLVVALIAGMLLFRPVCPPAAAAPPATATPSVCLRLNGYTVGDRIDTAHVAINTALYDAASGNGQIVLQKQPLLTALVRQHHILQLEQILSDIEVEITIQLVNGQLSQKPVFSASPKKGYLTGSYHWRYDDVSVTLKQGPKRGKWTLRLQWSTGNEQR
jgi:hypothetical protein